MITYKYNIYIYTYNIYTIYIYIQYIYNIYIYIQYIYIYTEYRGIVPHFAGAKGIQVFASPLAL